MITLKMTPVPIAFALCAWLMFFPFGNGPAMIALIATYQMVLWLRLRECEVDH